MDDFDHLLNHLPQETLPAGLARRACANFRRRRTRQQRFHIAASVALILLGIWLGGPGLLSLGAQLQNSSSSAGVLNALFSSLLDASTAYSTYTHSSNSLQVAMNNSLGLTAWVGILALAAGAWIGISGLLTRSLR